MELRYHKLKEKGLKFNIEKDFFGQTKMEYFWFLGNKWWHKIKNKNTTPTISQKEVCKFVGLVN